jgi:hypothetical protein
MIYEESGNWPEVCISGGWGTGGSHQKVPDARKARSPQDSMGRTLTKIPNKGEGEPEWTISRVWARTLVGGWGHPLISKILTQKGSCLKEIQGQSVEQRLSDLGIYRIYRQQYQTVLQMPRSVC